ncbi:Response regulator receiver domain-containing protein [Desulfacinum infernum DSM 9756]|uniref:Response regulator receiver domain-containing protein n=1 Tax=Desulfacinum infernum DSM 9756 TaxID=1121391 RepID=A0A1M5I0M4_9BACT|nr:response regulator transcription factor [Desulfacinum infernum]SHG21785.1 Response regulator receiver domain-containing protein [Desulfacinum infernum DSM 9756]
MRILMIEDDEVLSSFVARGLRSSGFVVEIARDGDAGLAMALESEVDILIVDIMLPRLDGFSIIREVRRAKPSLPILVLSARRSVDDRVQGLEIGGDDYLTKPFAFSELLARIRALGRRVGLVSESTVLQVGPVTVDVVRHTASVHGRQVDLQPKEFALLVYMARNAGRVLTRTQILNQVWGYQFDPGSNVVDVHVCRLRDKLGDKGDPRLIRTIRGVGYVFEA